MRDAGGHFVSIDADQAVNARRVASLGDFRLRLACGQRKPSGQQEKQVQGVFGNGDGFERDMLSICFHGDR